MTMVKFAAGPDVRLARADFRGAHNGLDIAVSDLTYYAVRVADKPADEEHHFGHAKIEAVVALFQTGFLFVLAAAVVYAALGGSAAKRSVDANAFAFAAILISIAVDIVRWRSSRASRAETGSDALAADALHYSSDLVASAAGAHRLAASRLGSARRRARGGRRGSVHSRRGLPARPPHVDALVDAAPRGSREDVRARSKHVPGVVGVDFLRLRRSGAESRRRPRPVRLAHAAARARRRHQGRPGAALRAMAAT